MSKKYCYSNDGERYFGQFDTADEALDEAKDVYEDEESVYIGTCTQPQLRWNSNEESIIESIYESLSEDVGEAAEGFEISLEQEKELSRMIDETVKTWVEQEKIEPQCYEVLDGHIVSLN